MLGLRDRLRTNEADRNRYAAVKRELSKKEWRHVQDYGDATTVVTDILTRALP
ncbi:GrpB family protein [Actinophytocola oryzae]|uniref:GrpB protein n=1 Tax=Actinophytocola oryzae TaxID=502181 RepID=A0A4R7VIE4_9PSEU|nr:GrpB family protein [Actinophytocola oryzae]TDV48965.1 GrpB protein [Actinophytocola oryzae]